MTSARYPFPASPNGWFCVGDSADLVREAVTPLHYLGRDLVAFRGTDGVARVFDAHCPHLGAHLGFGGCVRGEGISCPFHGWRFDREGRVVEVPGLDRPPNAALSAWEVMEQNDRIFIWHHAGGTPPDSNVVAYRQHQDEWTPWRSNTYRVRVHVQDLTENIIDRSHFSTVHDMQPPENQRFDVMFTGQTMLVDQSLKVTAVTDAGYEVNTKTTVWGPGIIAVEVSQPPIEMLTYITQTPVDDEMTEISLNFSMKRLADTEATEAICKMNDEITNAQFAQDVPIWEHKIYRDRPMVTKVDGPIHQYRRWYRQFYSSD
jgi:nitrite reductase/ring-hydroxylating ferredoxin subunit